jgi:hypothetical protein
VTKSEFVQALKIQTSDAAVFGTAANLERPPGRRPREQDAVLSQWYGKLGISDREAVNAAMREAAELAVFSFLCVLDGVSAIEDGLVKGELRLTYAKDGEELLLNDPAEGLLHDAYNALCRKCDPLPPTRSEARLYEVSPANQLRSTQTSGDGMDFHLVSPDGTSTPLSESPAIALPKNEHRKL